MSQDNSANSKRIAKNTLLLYVRMLFLMLISLYTSRVILNALGVEDYGIYNVVGGVVTMFSVFPKAKLKERGIPEDTWDDLINLRPFHADNNRKKSDDYPDYTREKVMNKETHKNITLEKAKIVNPEVQKAINEHYGFNDEIMYGEEDDD